MPLDPNTTLGPYSVTAKIGEGGMGEVYRARDTKLDRDVALKVLPQGFTEDPDRLARFEREAKVLASLNHTNIGGIYGLEESDGVRALVLEYIDGPTLADRIKQGPIPVDEALPIATQIAEALEAAHEQGVIHRDLKPANIKLKPDGTVKVLDFGLAKALEPETRDVSASMSPTISLTAAATQMGMVMGTAAYMAPEQAKGLPVDKRADIWAFGAVLFEMLTGKKLFAATDVSEMLASVLVKDPDVSSIGPHVPAHVRSVIRRCLVKDPKKRLRDIGDVQLAMDGVFDTAANTSSRETVSAPSGWRAGMPWSVAIALAIITGVAVWTAIRSVPSIPAPITRFPMALPADFQLTVGSHSRVALSPDGTHLAYAGSDQLYLRALDELEANPIRGTEGAIEPFFSPDGQWIGFWLGGQLRKVSVTGGVPVTICETNEYYGASWRPDDTILFGSPLGVWRVSGNGGTPELIVTPEPGQGIARPQLLPGGEWVLFHYPTQGYGVAIHSLVTGERHVLVENAGDARYLPTGHLVYVQDGTLLGMPFDVEQPTITGGAVPLVERVWQNTIGMADVAYSADGTLAYVLDTSRSRSDERILALVGRDGEVVPLNAPSAPYVSPRISPDGEKLVVQTGDDVGTALWLYDLSGDTQIQQLTFDGENRRPIWTPDSQHITFSSDRDGTMSLYRMPADGSGVPERLTTADEGSFHWPASWSPDGETLLFNVESNRQTDWDIWALSLSAQQAESLYDAPETVYLGAELSPSGRWIAYSAGPVVGSADIYVEPFPPTGGFRRNISQNGGIWPLWSPDGGRLFYRPVATVTGAAAGTTLRSVDVITEPEFQVRNELTLPVEGFTVVAFYRDYDITPDGEQLVMLFPDRTVLGEAAPPQINVTLNWIQELTQRVPVP